MQTIADIPAAASVKAAGLGSRAVVSLILFQVLQSTTIVQCAVGDLGTGEAVPDLAPNLLIADGLHVLQTPHRLDRPSDDLFGPIPPLACLGIHVDEGKNKKPVSAELYGPAVVEILQGAAVADRVAGQKLWPQFIGQAGGRARGRIVWRNGW